MMLFIGFSVILLLHSHQHNRLMTRTHPSCAISTSTTRHGPRDAVIFTVRQPTRTGILPLWSYNSKHLSTSRQEDEPDTKRYLSREAFPLGSFNFHVVGKEIMNKVKQQADKGTPEDVKLAFELLDRLFEEVIYVTNKKGDDSQRSDFMSWQRLFHPSDLVYKVVNAWRGSGSDSTAILSPRNVFAMVKKWETGLPDFQSTTYINSMMIHATVSLREPELAEEILDYLLDSIGKGTSVDVVSFNTAIDAWAKSGRADAPQRAEALLQKMIDFNGKGWVEVAPDVISFTSVITAWANSDHLKAPYHAEELLRNMVTRGLSPSDSSYSSVLTTWARSTEAHAAHRARAILEHMVELYKEGNNDAKPTLHCYSAVISAYANRGNAHEAEQLLGEQMKLYQSTKDRDFLPDVVGFTSVINAWAKSGRPEAPQKAEAILQQMQDLAESWGEPSLRPNVRSFSTVVDAWARSKDRDAPIRCEQILQRMQELYEKGHTGFQPNVFSYNSVLNSWAKSSSDEAPERAEAILRHMERLHKAGNTSAKPNCISHNTVMDAWARSGRWDAAERTQVLFDDLVQKYAGGDQEMKPNIQTYGTLTTAWGRSKRKDGAAKAQAAFDDMVFRYRSGDEELKPTVAQFNALINAWTKAGDPERAEDLLRQMESNASLGVMPDGITYSTVMDAWAQSRLPDAGSRAQCLFDELQQKHKAGDGKLQHTNVYRALISAWGRSKHKDGAAKAQAAFDELLACYESGAKNLKPDVRVYTALIDAWSKAGDPDRAEQVLRGMELNASIGVKPDMITYGAVMSGWSRSRAPKAVDRMFALYDEMKRRHAAGDRGLKPSSRIFDVLLSTWSYNSRRQDLWPKAQGVYEDVVARFRSREAELKPLVDKYSYLTKTTTKEAQK